MSTVRMCDRCAQVFSERAEGWSTFAGSRMTKNKDTGKMEQVTETLDQCPDCSAITLAPPPRPDSTTSRQALPGQVITQPHYEGQGD